MQVKIYLEKMEPIFSKEYRIILVFFFMFIDVIL